MSADTKKERTAQRFGVERFVSWFGTNIYRAICIGYLTYWTILATVDIGEMPQPEPYKWYLPLLVLMFLLPPVYFAYLAGREDAFRNAIDQVDSLGS